MGRRKFSALMAYKQPCPVCSSALIPDIPIDVTKQEDEEEILPEHALLKCVGCNRVFTRSQAIKSKKINECDLIMSDQFIYDITSSLNGSFNESFVLS